MKSNELMLGDIILKDGQPGRVIELYGGEVADCYAPVFITPEILEANGFIKTGYMCRCVHNLADFDNHAQLDYNLKFSTFEIKRMKNRAWTAKIYIDAHYVHELQHALRLAGLNDLADNFVIEKGGEQ